MEENNRRPRSAARAISELTLLSRIETIAEGVTQNLADPPSLICVGCDAYKDHQR